MEGGLHRGPGSRREKEREGEVGRRIERGEEGRRGGQRDRKQKRRGENQAEEWGWEENDREPVRAMGREWE